MRCRDAKIFASSSGWGRAVGHPAADAKIFASLQSAVFQRLTIPARARHRGAASLHWTVFIRREPHAALRRWTIGLRYQKNGGCELGHSLRDYGVQKQYYCWSLKVTGRVYVTLTGWPLLRPGCHLGMAFTRRVASLS